MRTLMIPIALTALTICSVTAFADEAQVVLKAGDGVEETSANCAACHSLDYIKMNSPFLGAETWKAEVTKMRKAFGAAIDDETATKIAAYLATQYGPAS